MMAYLETYKGVVSPSDCDILGHMNVSRYFAACSDAGFHIQMRLGFTLQDMNEGRRLSFAVVHADSDFRAEVMAGETIIMMTGIERIGAKSITFHHRLLRAETNTLAFETHFKCVCLDLRKRRAATIPDDVREKAAAYRVEDDNAKQ